MLSELYNLADQYKEKNIYIWEVNRSSMQIFALFANKRISVQGFVTAKERFARESIMNRSVVFVRDIEEEKDVLLVVSDHEKADEVTMNFAENTLIQVITYKDCFSVDYRLKDKEIILYGMGRGGMQVRRHLEKNGMKVAAYVLTEVSENDRRSVDEPVYSVDRLSDTRRTAVIITVMQERLKVRAEMLRNLEQAGIENIWINGSVVPEYDISNSITWQQIDQANKHDKKIYIYGKHDKYGELIEDILRIYGISCAGYMDVSQLHDVYYEGFEDKFFIVNSLDAIEKQRLCDELEELNISINNLSYTGIRYVCAKRPFFKKHIPDCLVGYADIAGDYSGISVLGNEKANTRVVILGGSTSAARTYRSKTWVESLYEILYNRIGDVVIYNFAFPGNTVAVELLKLLRDGYHMRPNWVISMSGLNDLRQMEDAVNPFNVQEIIGWLKILDPKRSINTGVETKEDLFSYWLRIQSIIKAVTEIYGAEYLGILQPMNLGKNNKDLFETMVFEFEDVNIQSVYELSEEDSFYLNLLRLLEDETENMYVDGVHYTERAGKIIADKIATVLLQKIE